MPDYMENDGPAQESPAPAMGNQDGEDKGEGQTFLINSEACPGMKPGDTMELKIVAVHDKEYEVSYQPEEKGEDGQGGDGEAPAEAPTPASPGGGMMD